MHKTNRKSASFLDLCKLFLVFFKIGICTFGGGLAMLPFLERELAQKHKWTTEDKLLDYYAIGQSTPGIIAVNVATFVGYTQYGVLGALFATGGIVTPSLIIITCIALGLANFQDNVWVQKALAGINVAVAALMTQVVYTFARKCIKNIFGVFLCIASFAAVTFLNLHSVYIIIVSALSGILFSYVSARLSIKKASKAQDTTTASQTKQSMSQDADTTPQTKQAMSQNADTAPQTKQSERSSDE